MSSTPPLPPMYTLTLPSATSSSASSSSSSSYTTTAPTSPHTSPTFSPLPLPSEASTTPPKACPYVDISYVFHLTLTDAAYQLGISRKTLHKRWKIATGGTRAWPSTRLASLDRRILSLLQNLPSSNAATQPYVASSLALRTGHLNLHELIKVRQWIAQNRHRGDHGHGLTYTTSANANAKDTNMAPKVKTNKKQVHSTTANNQATDQHRMVVVDTMQPSSSNVNPGMFVDDDEDCEVWEMPKKPSSQVFREMASCVEHLHRLVQHRRTLTRPVFMPSR